MISIEDKTYIKEIKKYFGVSEECAKYMYYRSRRSTIHPRSPRYLYWDLALQNALVKLDKILGVNWDKLIFGKEKDQLLEQGIDFDYTETKTIIWNNQNADESDNFKESGEGRSSEESGKWNLVNKKKYKFTKLNIIK